jgi:hypothetical protein
VLERFSSLPGTMGMVRLSKQAIQNPEIYLSDVVRCH